MMDSGMSMASSGSFEVAGFASRCRRECSLQMVISRERISGCSICDLASPRNATNSPMHPRASSRAWWTAGTGMAWAVAQNWNVFAEYRQTSYRTAGILAALRRRGQGSGK
jgi:opacity protein-like surface antigen